MALEIQDPGPLTTIQDRGRFGFGFLGIGRAGALDAASADASNRLVGNNPDAALLEITMGGLVAVARRPMLVCVTGAEVPVWLDQVEHPTNVLLSVREGQSIRIGLPAAGVRAYLAIRGGVESPVVLGSRSADTLGGLGPAPLRRGTVVEIGHQVEDFPAINMLFRASTPVGPHRLRFVVGPRHDWFTTNAFDVLARGPWRVTPLSNRIGFRLEGPTLERQVTSELPSEGVALGSIQVAPSGPIVFHRDHPVTGGYPVIGVVNTSDLDRLAQARAGDRVEFVNSGAAQ